MSGKKTVVLAVTGSIAAYKAVLVARLLHKAGVRVIPVMSRAAHAFVGASTFSGLLGEEVLSEMFDPASPGERHVDLAKQADLVLIAPATADVLARLAQGRADDLITALALSFGGDILVAPAMHPDMWENPATRRNRALLEEGGRVRFVGPVTGEVASGDSGEGRLAEPEAIVRAVLDALETQRDLAETHVVVSAGPTIEDLDPVRFIGNRSTGKMGFAIATRAAARGARVTLVAGPVTLKTPRGVARVDVRSAREMQAALHDVLGADLGGADALIMTAAVADYRPKVVATKKIKRKAADLTLELEPNPDLLRGIGEARKGPLPILIGFAVETAPDAELVALGRKKLADKRVDMVVVNHASDGFAGDDNRAFLVDRDKAEQEGVLGKLALADRILDDLVPRIARARAARTDP